MKRFNEMTNFSVAPSLSAITAATISGAITTAATALMAVAVELTGTITNTSVTLSVALIDENGVTVWSAPMVAAVRTLPGGVKVADLLFFDIFRVNQAKIALESAITGGGTATVRYAFAGV